MRRRVGIRPEGKAPAREGAAVSDQNGAAVGRVTSGGFGPTIGGPIAMGYVDTLASTPGTLVRLAVRGKQLDARVVGLPFVPTRYQRP